MPSMHLSQIRRWLLQSPPAEWVVTQLREVLIGALRQGPIPRHVAFVMDGNRRFARNQGIETVEGHNFGFEALAKILEVCYKSGIRTVTIYAFSIENFKRSKHEVAALMDLAKVKLMQLSQHGDLCERYGVRIQVLGRRELLSPEVAEKIGEVERITAGNGDAVLNICGPYTSHDEITHSVRETVEEFSKPVSSITARPFSQSHISHTIRTRNLGTSAASKEIPRVPSPIEETIPDAEDSAASSTLNASESASTATSYSASPDPDTAKLPLQTSKSFPSLLSTHPPPSSMVKAAQPYPDPEAITEATITSHLFTADDPPLDLLIRTSGVERLSDFMLWQCHEETDIVFSKTLWPEFDLLSFLPILVEWQWRHKRRGNEEGESRKGR
ncbi:MAG: hypothetical protein Q9191_002617 [Dirinaria sp. TL-2023a]